MSKHRIFVKNLLMIFIGLLIGSCTVVCIFLFIDSSTPSLVPRTSENKDVSKGASKVRRGPLALDEINARQVDLRGVVTAIETTDEEHRQFVRRYSLYSLVSQLSEVEIKQLLSQIWDSQWTISYTIRVELQTVLLEHLVMKSPHDAVEFVCAYRQGRPNLDGFLVDMFFEWAKSDLDEAVAKAREISKSSRKFAMQAIIRALADFPVKRQRELATTLYLDNHFVEAYLNSPNLVKLKNPDQVWSAVINMAQQDDDHVPRLLEIAQHWYRLSGVEALDKILASLTDSGFRESFIPSLLQLIAEVEPELAFDYVFNKLSGETKIKSAGRVVSAWTALDPTSTFEAVAGLESDWLQEELQQRVVQDWAVRDPEYVLKNISNFPHQIRITGANSAIRVLTDESPNKAVHWVLQLEDKIVQINAANTLVTRWSQHDLHAVSSWVQDEPAIADFRGFLSATLAMAMVSINPLDAFELAKSLSLTQGKIGLEADIVSQVALEDIALALSLLPNVRDGDSKVFAYEKVGVALVKNGDFQRAVDLGLQLDASDYSNYYQSIFYIWVNVNYDELYELLPKLPNEEARSKAARALVILNTNNDYLTKIQIKELDQYLTKKDRDILSQFASPNTP